MSEILPQIGGIPFQGRYPAPSLESSFRRLVATRQSPLPLLDRTFFPSQSLLFDGPKLETLTIRRSHRNSYASVQTDGECGQFFFPEAPKPCGNIGFVALRLAVVS
jgi:hypothetical protein